MPKMLLFQHAISIKNTEMFYLHFLFHVNLQNPVYTLNLKHILRQTGHILRTQKQHVSNGYQLAQCSSGW